MGCAAAFRGMSAGHGLALLADVPDGERRDRSAQPVIRRTHSVVTVPVLARRRDQIGEPIQEPGIAWRAGVDWLEAGAWVARVGKPRASLGYLAAVPTNSSRVSLPSLL